MTNLKNITFILPTKNRVNQLKLFFNYHYKILDKIKHNFLIIDASNDLNHIKNIKNLKQYKNIKIIRQFSKGIQKGCIEAIPFIKTKYSTFLYDDDYLGKYVVDIYKSNIDNKNIFSLGCGIIQDLKKKANFKKINYSYIDKQKMLLAYYGRKLSIMDDNILPVSPICTSFETKFLKKWKYSILKFVKKNSFREFFFFQKDIGPDMLIYLMLIGDSKKVVKFYTPYSVKFSSHPDSISIIYGNSYLRIGYWLARVCYFQNDTSMNKKTKNESYTYLIIIGMILIISNLFNFYILKNIIIEFFKLLKLKSNFLFSYFVKYLTSRIFIKL